MVRMSRLRDILILAYFVAMTATVWLSHPVVRHLEAEARIRRCEGQLRELRKAVLAYCRDHGRYPPRLGMLYPRYVKDARLFVCPSAVGRIREGSLGYTVELGQTTGHSAYALTYLAPEHETIRKIRGGLTPVIVCDAHVQNVMDEAWGIAYGGLQFARRHGDPPFLVARLNGRVDRLPFSEIGRRKLRSSNEF